MSLTFSLIDNKAKSRFDGKNIQNTKNDQLRNISETENISLNCTVPCSANNTASYSIDRKTHTLKSGTEGSVRVAKNLNTNTFCLVKIKSSYNISELFSASRREYKLAKEYSDAYMLAYQEVQSKEQGKAYLFMNEISGRTIEEFNAEGLSAIECLRIIHNLLLELSVLGQKNINHNDINDSNIIIDDNFDIYFIDFGRSTKNTMNGLIYGYDFDAICEIIIDDLNLIRYDRELETLLRTKLDTAKDASDNFNYIDINDLILEVENRIHNSKDQKIPLKKRNQTEFFSSSTSPIDDHIFLTSAKKARY
ncbi:hypothetical protein CC99x_007190 [Candidatus Berkiella cookevillensis]|uniref:Bifunctional UGMP family protein/serine/threonine protein kinase n=1 Tax=Candidatus Berkiella cookevillensis TaxID=437022 RepID=A0A0Q9YL10_9GAMM|nr:protein kinase family protein [Candidatus Berkiella cookevillensis]MCS5708691.1 hypothetical protein [Candidatus Berkiella cookevillensis]